MTLHPELLTTMRPLTACCNVISSLKSFVNNASAGIGEAANINETGIEE
jgi:hypothetical protein